MEGILVVKSSDEMYRIILSKSLPSMDIPSIHGWRISMSGMHDQLVSLGDWRHGVGPVEDFLDKLNATVADHASDFRYDPGSDYEVDEIHDKNSKVFGAFSSQHRAEGRQERWTTVGTTLHGPTFDKSCAGDAELVSLSVCGLWQVSPNGSACTASPLARHYGLIGKSPKSCG